MSRNHFLPFLLCVHLVLAASFAHGQSNEFTYQGRLLDNSLPATANYDFQFSLWDSLVSGTQQGTTQTLTGVAVANGIFTVKLNFGANFPGSSRFLQIAMRPSGSGGYTTLAPRQSITSAPHAIRSQNAGAADTATTAGNVSGVVAVANGGTGSSTKNFVDLTTNQTISGTKTFSNPLVANGSQITNINGANITDNTISASAFDYESFPNNRNFTSLGLLRWDLLAPTVAVAEPDGVAFDGSNIWIANTGFDTITKLRASDGSNLGTFATGDAPLGVAFDGANIWVTNGLSNNVSKKRASDGAQLGLYSVGANPRGVAFDGANIWVANGGGTTVTKLRASDGALLGTYTVGTSPYALAFDGVNMWVANYNSQNITKLRASDGAVLGTFTTGTSPYKVAFDGLYIWVANLNSDSVTKLRASNGASLGTYAVGDAPSGVAFDGTNIWVSIQNGDVVVKLRPSDGAVLETYPVGDAPVHVAFDGGSIWVSNKTGNSLTKIPVFR